MKGCPPVELTHTFTFAHTYLLIIWVILLGTFKACSLSKFQFYHSVYFCFFSTHIKSPGLWAHKEGSGKPVTCPQAHPGHGVVGGGPEGGVPTNLITQKRGSAHPTETRCLHFL